MLGDEFSYIPQTGDDLGERMKLAFLRCFSEGARSVVLIGSDIPDLPARIVDEAFRALDENDAVIGPAADGGYYLIGFKRDTFNGNVFPGIPGELMRSFERRWRFCTKPGRSCTCFPCGGTSTDTKT